MTDNEKQALLIYQKAIIKISYSVLNHIEINEVEDMLKEANDLILRGDNNGNE